MFWCVSCFELGLALLWDGVYVGLELYCGATTCFGLGCGAPMLCGALAPATPNSPQYNTIHCGANTIQHINCGASTTQYNTTQKRSRNSKVHSPKTKPQNNSSQERSLPPRLPTKNIPKQHNRASGSDQKQYN